MFTFVKRFLREEEGASMVEYGLLLALIAVVAIAALTTVGTNIKSMFTTVGGQISGS